MPFDGSGNFSRLYNWQSDRDNGIHILASRMDGECDNFAAGLNVVFFRNGLVPMSGNLQMGQNYITGIGSGSLGALPIRFGDDPNSGMYLDGLNKPSIAVSGTKRLEVNSLGITVTGLMAGTTLSTTGAATVGTTLGVTGAVTLGAGLTVATGVTVSAGGAAITGDSTVTGTLGVTGSLNAGGGTITGSLSVGGNFDVVGQANVGPTSGTANGSIFLRSNGASTFSSLVFYNAGVIGQIASQATTGFTYYDFGTHIFRTVAGVERMRIAASGNIGIGTSSPQSPFCVSNAGTSEFGFAPGITANTSIMNTYNRSTLLYDSMLLDVKDFSLRINGLGANDFVVSSAGFVGIGIAPAAPFHTKGGGEVRFQTTVARGSGTSYVSFYDPTGRKGRVGYAGTGDDGIYLWNDLNDAIVFGTNAIERARFSAAGDFTKTGMGGYHYDGANYGTSKVTQGTAAPAGGADGDIYYQYQ